MKPIVITLTEDPAGNGLTQIKKGHSVNLQTLKQVITRAMSIKPCSVKEGG